MKHKLLITPKRI